MLFHLFTSLFSGDIQNYIDRRSNQWVKTTKYPHPRLNVQISTHVTRRGGGPELNFTFICDNNSIYKRQTVIFDKANVFLGDKIAA